MNVALKTVLLTIILVLTKACTVASPQIGQCASPSSVSDVTLAADVTWYKDILPMMLSKEVGTHYQCASCHDYDKKPELVISEIDNILRSLRGEGLVLMPRAGDRWPDQAIEKLEVWSKKPLLGNPSDAAGFGIDMKNYIYEDQSMFLKTFDPGVKAETSHDC